MPLSVLIKYWNFYYLKYIYAHISPDTRSIGLTFWVGRRQKLKELTLYNFLYKFGIQHPLTWNRQTIITQPKMAIWVRSMTRDVPFIQFYMRFYRCRHNRPKNSQRSQSALNLMLPIEERSSLLCLCLIEYFKSRRAGIWTTTSKKSLFHRWIISMSFYILYSSPFNCLRYLPLSMRKKLWILHKIFLWEILDSNSSYVTTVYASASQRRKIRGLQSLVSVHRNRTCVGFPVRCWIWLSSYLVLRGFGCILSFPHALSESFVSFPRDYWGLCYQYLRHTLEVVCYEKVEPSLYTSTASLIFFQALGRRRSIYSTLVWRLVWYLTARIDPYPFRLGFCCCYALV